ncbi:MAG: GNAT family N-acetyltransferase [Proteobacteria bacterium]|nr:GNAT family N-acetyltransferase [Pseudomonadota bacterium]
MKNIEIEDLREKNFKEWLTLWDDNNGGRRNDAVTKETWSRLLNPVFPVHGFAARVDGRMAGLVHYILHPVTGHIQPVCYMQDLYVAPEFRQRGIARALVRRLAAIGKREGWARMYWLAETKNEAAQQLYKNLGVKLDFTLHVLPL